MMERLLVLLMPPSALALAVAIALYFLRHPEQLERWEALLARATDWVSESARRRRIALDVQSRVNIACERINAEAPDVMPYALKIEWAEDVDRDSFVREGQVIVRMSRDPNDDANVVRATLAYLTRGFLAEARIYPPPDLTLATDFVVARMILQQRRTSSAVHYFYDHVWGPTTRAQPGVRTCASQIEVLDADGLFTRIYLPELKLLGERLRMRTPDARVADEVASFLQFLETLAARGEGEEVELSFIARSIRVHIVLVAKRETLGLSGTEAHQRRVAEAVSRGAHVVYLLAIGGDNPRLAMGVAKGAQQSGVIVISKVSRYHLLSPSGRANPAICITCEAAARERRVQPAAMRPDIAGLLGKCCPEVANGEVEVMGMGATPGRVAKIAVRSASEAMQATEWCHQVTSSDRTAQLRGLLGVDRLHFIPWSDDVCELAVAALAPLRAAAVVSVSHDADTNEVHVEVHADGDLRHAVGREGANVKAAMQLLGRRIVCSLADETTGCPTDSLEPARRRHLVEAAVRNNVPEVANGSVELVAVGYLGEDICKVAVRAVDRTLSAVAACVGRNGERAEAVKSALGVSIFGVVDWDPDPVTVAVRALYPLREGDIETCPLQVSEDGVLRITVRSSSAARQAIGPGGANVRVAEAVAGIEIDVRSAAPRGATDRPAPA